MSATKPNNGRGRAILERIRDSLLPVLGSRLRGLVLYGSEARGDARPDSDVDVLVLLDRVSRNRLDDVSLIADAVFSLSASMTGFRPISALPVDFDAFQEDRESLFVSAKSEGISL